MKWPDRCSERGSSRDGTPRGGGGGGGGCLLVWFVDCNFRLGHGVHDLSWPLLRTRDVGEGN